MRISDHERQRAVDELTQHLSAGRIGMDDYVDRIGEVYEAQTLADIDHARRDLPWMRVALPPGSGTGGADRRAPAPQAQWRARLLLALTALLVVVGVVVALTAQAVWVALLFAGWLIGVAQGRASARRR